MPLAGGIAFGLGPLLLPQTMAEYTGFAGNDPLVGRYAGAATLGYAVALAVGIAEGRAYPLRLVMLATLVSTSHRSSPASSRSSPDRRGRSCT